MVKYRQGMHLAILKVLYNFMLTVNRIQPKSLNTDGVHCLIKELIKINYNTTHFTDQNPENLTIYNLHFGFSCWLQSFEERGCHLRVH